MTFRDAGLAVVGSMDDLIGWLKGQTATTILLFANFLGLCYGLAYGVPATIAQVQAGYDRHRGDLTVALKAISDQAREEQVVARADFVRVLENQRSDFLAQLTRERELWLNRLNKDREAAAAAVGLNFKQPG